MIEAVTDARLAGILLSCALSVACATSPPPTTASRALPPAVILDYVPFHPQTEYQCGPAALAMVLAASGVEISPDELVPQVYTPARKGSLQPEMIATPRRHGRISYALGDSLDALLTEVAAGHPVLVLQNLALPLWPMWHYAVVVGYDLGRSELILHTGENRRQRVSMGRFLNTWNRSGRWGLLVLAPGRLPVGGDTRDIFDAIHAFERVAGTDAAEPAWTALTIREPGHALAWFARGNAHHATGRTADAVAAFEQATALDPGFGAAWSNLGHALEMQGQRTEAIHALERAAAIGGPWQEQARHSLQRVRSTPSGS